MTYEEFIESKRHSAQDKGIYPTFIPDQMFPFQKYVLEYAVKKGRCAVFLDTGLGKTLIELATAVNYVRETNKPALIITPLAVAFQFLKEDEKFGIGESFYSKDGKYPANKKIIICNYERIHYFNPAEFDCVILDESSILKNCEGANRHEITSFMKKVKYRYLFTATPSPNDFTELGTSSEALGEMGYTDMLTRFFKNNEDTISPQSIGTQWRLKGHAQTAFFEWVSTWSISMRKPSDLGFDDKSHVLPRLITNLNEVENTKPLVINGQHQLFNIVAKTQKEVNAERAITISERCDAAIDLCQGHERSVYWVNLNPEGDHIAREDKDAVQISGTMDIDTKEAILKDFSEGNIRRLVTKPKITAFGLNWQHCNHTVFFPTFSYEQYYQAIRRFWRFGQVNDVIVDLVYSNGQKRLIDAINAKSEKANQLFSLLNSNINRSYQIRQSEYNKQIQIPSFL